MLPGVCPNEYLERCTRDVSSICQDEEDVFKGQGIEHVTFDYDTVSDTCLESTTEQLMRGYSEGSCQIIAEM